MIAICQTRNPANTWNIDEDLRLSWMMEHANSNISWLSWCNFNLFLSFRPYVFGTFGKKVCLHEIFYSVVQLAEVFFQKGWTWGSNKMTELVNQPFFFQWLSDFNLFPWKLGLPTKKHVFTEIWVRFVSMISSRWFNYLQLVPFYTGVSNPVIVLQPQWHAAAILCLQGGRSRWVNAEKPSIVLDRDHWN